MSKSVSKLDVPEHLVAAVVSEDQRDRVQCSGADGRAGADVAGNRSTDEY